MLCHIKVTDNVRKESIQNFNSIIVTNNNLFFIINFILFVDVTLSDKNLDGFRDSRLQVRPETRDSRPYH